MTPSSPNIQLRQTITTLQIGQRIRCIGAFNYPGDGDALLEAVQITMNIDGQVCGQAVSFDTNGWARLESAGEITVMTDNPVVEVQVYLDNFFGYSLNLGLDSFAVVPEEQSSLPVCSYVTPVRAD
jgi:hypothetical protein